MSQQERGRAARLATLIGFTLLTAAAALAYPWLAKGQAWLGVRWQMPLFLLGLALVPLVYWRSTLGEDRRVPLLKVGLVSVLARGPAGWRVLLRDLPGVLRSVALALLVLALAQPVSTLGPSSSEEEGIDAVLVLDLSGSMRAVIDSFPADLARLAPERPPGVRPTRLDAAKAVIRDFISRRKTDRIGVVVFGQAAYVLSPPTLDYHLLDALVSRMSLELIDGAGTAIGDAIGVAVARLRRSHATSKAVILLTDGDNNAGKLSPDYSAHLASVVGAKVYTIQIGDGQMAEVQDGFDLFGQPRYVTVPFATNPELLREIAEKTGGETYVATDATALQASLHDVLDRLEKTVFEATIASYEDLFPLLLLPAALLIALEALLRSLVLRRFP